MKLISYMVAVVTVLLANQAMACKASIEHNTEYHGDPQCAQCTCVHNKDSHEMEADDLVDAKSTEPRIVPAALDGSQDQSDGLIPSVRMQK